MDAAETPRVRQRALTIVLVVVLALGLGMNAAVSLWVVRMVREEDVPQLPSAPPTRAGKALWVSCGERLGSGVESLGMTDLFRSGAVPGRSAANWLAKLIAARRPKPGTMVSHQRRAALVLWLTRHASEAQLQRLLEENVWFGCGERGIEAAAQAYFGRPAEALTGEALALLVRATRAPTRARKLGLVCPLPDPLPRGERE